MRKSNLACQLAAAGVKAEEELRGFHNQPKDRDEHKRPDLFGISAGLCVSMLLHLYKRRETRLQGFFGLEQMQSWKNFEAAPGERPLLFCGENYSITG
jgi:hypothetical protein